MSSVSNSLAKAIEKAAEVWDPAKHPKGRDGRFLEVGDLVGIHNSPTSGQVGTGKVIGGHYDGVRMWIAVSRVDGTEDNGKVEWYRPKQLEEIEPKAVLLPKAPLPEAGSKDKAPSWTIQDADSYKTWVDAAHGDPQLLSNAMMLAASVKDPEHELLQSVAKAVKFNPVTQGTDTDTPEAKKLKDQVRLIVASASNKQLPYDIVEKIRSNVEAALVDPDPVTGHKKLATAMTLAKLGGKQRARYKQILDELFNREPTLPQVPKSTMDAHPVGSGVNSPLSAAKPLKSKVPTLSEATKYVDSEGIGAHTAKSRIQVEIAQRMSDVPLERFAEVFQGSPGMSNSGASAEELKVLQVALGNEPIDNAKTLRRDRFNGIWHIGGSAASYGGSDVITNPTLEDYKRAAREAVVRALVQTWAATSNDNNPRSLAMQKLTVEEFGLDPAFIYDWHTKPQYLDEHIARHRELYRRFLREMYNWTQADLKAQGWTHVRLRRGVSTRPGQIYKDQVGSVAMCPLSSFSSKISTARKFGGYVMDVYIPIERILGSAVTGFGCKNEQEFVVIGGPGVVKLIEAPYGGT